MKIERFKFRVEGMTPLLMCSDKAMMEAGAEKSQVKNTTTRKDSPAEVAESMAYRMADGNLYLPTICFRQCLIYAASGKRVKNRALGKILAAAIFAATDKTVLVDKAGKPLKDYTIDTRGAVNPTRGRIPVHRPRLEEWYWYPELDVDVQYVGAKEVLEPLANEAGMVSGLGAYRVSCGGWFGRFKAEIVS